MRSISDSEGREWEVHEVAIDRNEPDPEAPVARTTLRFRRRSSDREVHASVKGRLYALTDGRLRNLLESAEREE